MAGQKYFLPGDQSDPFYGFYNAIEEYERRFFQMLWLGMFASWKCISNHDSTGRGKVHDKEGFVNDVYSSEPYVF